MWASSLIDRIESAHWIPILAIGGGLLAMIITSLAHNIRKMKETQSLNDLKRDLIAQGRPTDEIERICNAGLKKSGKTEC